MKTKLTAIFLTLILGTMALAHGDDRGEFGDLGLGGLVEFGLGLGFGHHGGFGGDSGSNLADNVDVLQTHFQTRFDNLKTKYDDGVANTTDFFTTDTYDSIVDKTQSLSDRYDFFVTGVQNAIDRVTTQISNANDDITFYDNLLTNYQDDSSISASKLARIELMINHITDRLNSKVDSLTTEQTTLQTNLPTYQTFQTDLETFLSTIQAAGGGDSGSTTTTSSGLKAMLMSTRSLSAGSSSGSCGATSMPISSTSVPETSLPGLLLIAGATIPIGGRRRRTRN